MLFPIETISLINYRCFDNLNISFNNKTTFFYGNNGIGKTSLLEAIFLITNKRKLFRDQYFELIKNQQDRSFIKATLNLNDDTEEWSASIDRSKCLFYLNNNMETEKTNHSFYLSSNLIYDFLKSKNYRLNVLLNFISRKDYGFKRDVKKLEALINSINTHKNVNSKEFLFLEKEIRIVESSIVPKITSFINEFNKKSNIYNKNIIEMKESNSYRSIIKTVMNNDITIKNNFGPLNLMSQGQKRLTVISFMFELIKGNNEIKLILLDDIFDELDDNNRNFIFNLCEMFQTIITSSKNLDFSEWSDIEKVRLYNEWK